MGRHSIPRKEQAQAGRFLPRPARPGCAPAGQGLFHTCPERRSSLRAKGTLWAVPLPSLGLLCTSTFSLAGKLCGHCWGPRDTAQGAGCQGGAELPCASAPVSRTPVSVGNEGCDGP